MTLADMKPTPAPANRIQRPLSEREAETVLRTREYGWPEETVVEARECAVARARASYEASLMRRAMIRPAAPRNLRAYVLPVAMAALIGLASGRAITTGWSDAIDTAMDAQAGGW